MWLFDDDYEEETYKDDNGKTGLFKQKSDSDVYIGPLKTYPKIPEAFTAHIEFVVKPQIKNQNDMKINEIIEYCWYHASKSYLWSGEDDIYPFRGAALIFGTIFLNILTVITVINIIYGIDLFWIGKVLTVIVFLASLFYGTEKRFRQAEKKFKRKKLFPEWTIFLYIILSIILLLAISFSQIKL